MSLSLSLTPSVVTDRPVTPNDFLRGLSLGHHKVDAETKEAEQIPTVPVDYGFCGQPEDRAHDTLPVLIVRDRKSNGIWSHQVPSKGEVHPYPARALMADLDFMGFKRAVKNGWHGETVPEASPKGESKSNGEAQRAVQSVHRLVRTLKDFFQRKSGIALDSRSPLLAWLVEHCSNLLILFHTGEPHDGHTAYMRLKGTPWRIELPSFGECVDYRERSRHKMEWKWSRGVFVGVRVKTTERIVMDETWTNVVQSV